jgi:AraC-like DNA-binding protein
LYYNGRILRRYELDKGGVMREFYYQVHKESKNMFYKLYIHKIGPFRFNWHKEIEVNIILKGKVEFCVQGKKYLLEEDECIIINSNSGHATLAKEPDSIAMVLHLDPIYFKEYFKDYESLRFENIINVSEKGRENCKAINYLLASLIEELKKTSEERQIISNTIISLVVVNVIRMFSSSKENVKKIKQSKSQMKVISKVLKFIEDNYKEKISLNKIANMLNYNPCYFSQFFKANIGINYYEYLTRIRIREATFDLVKTERSISDIALEHGFSDAKSFNKGFKDSFGRSPNQYRSEIKNSDSLKQLVLRRVFICEDDEYVNTKLQEYRNLFEDNLLFVNKVNLKKYNEIEEERNIEKYKERITKLENDVNELNKKIELMRGILN